MKKLMILASAFLLVFGVAGVASATTIDTVAFTSTGIVNNPNGGMASTLDGFGGSHVNMIERFGDYLNWTHNFDLNGVPALNGYLTISLRDDQDFHWVWTGLFRGYWEEDTNDETGEYAFGWGEDWQFDLGEVDSGIKSYTISGNYLNDGAYSLGIVGMGGDFYVDSSTLQINPVPEPATMLLLGIGLVGLAGIGRKKFMK